MRGVGAATKDFARHLGAKLAVECEQVESYVRSRPHREDIGERVRCGDAAELVGIVHDGREEVDREHGCRRLVDFPHRRVVARLEPEQKLVLVGQVDCGREAVQRVFEVTRTPLRRSTAFAGELRQCDLFLRAHGQPPCSSVLSIPAPAEIRASCGLPAEEGRIEPILGDYVHFSRWCGAIAATVGGQRGASLASSSHAFSFCSGQKFFFRWSLLQSSRLRREGKSTCCWEISSCPESGIFSNKIVQVISIISLRSIHISKERCQ